MRRVGSLYVDSRNPPSVVQINRVILCPVGEDLYEVTDVVTNISYMVDGENLGRDEISQVALMDWLKTP